MVETLPPSPQIDPVSPRIFVRSADEKGSVLLSKDLVVSLVYLIMQSRLLRLLNHNFFSWGVDDTEPYRGGQLVIELLFHSPWALEVAFSVLEFCSRMWVI